MVKGTFLKANNLEEIHKGKPIQKKCVHWFTPTFSEVHASAHAKYRPLSSAVQTLLKRLGIGLKFNHGIKFKSHDLKVCENFNENL